MCNRSKIIIFFFIFLLFTSAQSARLETINVFVSILPQQYLVERVGGELVHVNVMVKPGQSPETFEPSPKLMSMYSKSNVYFTIGMPFEQVWIERVASLNQSISIVNTQTFEDQAHKMQPLENHQHEAESNEARPNKVNSHSLLPGRKHLFDPHTWLSPVMALAQAKVILLELVRLSPKNKTFFETRYQQLANDIQQLHHDIKSNFKNNKQTRFVTFHPAFSYFAREYGLTQLAIEVGGKEPSARQIARVINDIKDKNVSYVLIEKQFNKVIPTTIANTIDAQLLILDPLALDYLTNMRDIAHKINKALF